MKPVPRNMITPVAHPTTGDIIDIIHVVKRVAVVEEKARRERVRVSPLPLRLALYLIDIMTILIWYED